MNQAGRHVPEVPMREIQLKDTNKATLPAVLTRLGRKKAGLIWALRVSETRRDAEFRTPHDCIAGGGK